MAIHNLFIEDIIIGNGECYCGRSLDLRGTQMTQLPDNLTVKESLNLSGTQITQLPKNLIVGGSLYLRNTQITQLPDNLIIGGCLELGNTQITQLPNNLTVGHVLDLSDTQISQLPNNLTVGWDLHLNGTQITQLPSNFTVGGTLDLRETQITQLPNNLTVGMSLIINKTQMSQLPNNLTVGEKIWLSHPITVAERVADDWDEIFSGNYKKLPENHILTWQNEKYIKIEGIFSELIEKKENLYVVREIGRKELIYIATNGVVFAYGNTVEEANKSLKHKISENAKLEKYKSMTLNTVLTVKETFEAYRIIVGACAFEYDDFVESLKQKKEYTIKEIIKLSECEEYGWEFEEFFRKK